MKVALRLAAPADLPAIVAIEAASFPCPWSERTFSQEIANEFSTFKVLAGEEQVIGYYDLWVCADEAHLLNVAVAPAHRRRGLGTALVRDAVEEARRARCTRIILEVRPANEAALALYAAFGFRKIGERPHYYADGERADVLGKEL
ncbi:MAG: ribosomal protein S18-alanine N-acetyltransferase [Candidatus Coatesbacteria bacterium]|nr:MAG: ribosomal protein S18-alanine N-acetyltransferase [Candidatus Coatesbacteria bacterium]